MSPSPVHWRREKTGLSIYLPSALKIAATGKKSRFAQKRVRHSGHVQVQEINMEIVYIMVTANDLAQAAVEVV
jgi:hypothetical protein